MGDGVRRVRIRVAVLVTLSLIACGKPSSAVPGGTLPPLAAQAPHANVADVIAHIVVVIQENRSFDDFFATFPDVDGATKGMMEDQNGREISVPLKMADLAERCDFGHGYHGFLRNYDSGKMDGFGLIGNKCSGNHTEAYQYVNPAQIAPYWDLAQRYVLADHMFQTQGSGSFTAHQDLIAGGTTYDADKNLTLVDYPTTTPWGCDAPPGTVTSRLQWTGSQIAYRYDGGPFPCMGYRTLRDLLDAKSISWKYYSPPVQGGEGMLWNAFDAIKAVRNGAQWSTNVTQSEKRIFFDIAKHRLPAVSWVVPDRLNSDHPGTGSDTGPSWVASIVNAIGKSSYWTNTIIVVVWDDWGGFYDNAPPPFFDHWGGLGFRVPMILVSAYTPAVPSGKTFITHKRYEFASILRLIETTFHTGRLGTTDMRARDLLDCFDFSQPPRKFEKIRARYPQSYFEHQRPSDQPVDDE